MIDSGLGNLFHISDECVQDFLCESMVGVSEKKLGHL